MSGVSTSVSLAGLVAQGVCLAGLVAVGVFGAYRDPVCGEHATVVTTLWRSNSVRLPFVVGADWSRLKRTRFLFCFFLSRFCSVFDILNIFFI